MKENLLDQELLRRQLEESDRLKAQRDMINESMPKRDIKIEPETLDTIQGLLPTKPIDYETYQTKMDPEQLSEIGSNAQAKSLFNMDDLEEDNRQIEGLRNQIQSSLSAPRQQLFDKRYEELLNKLNEEKTRREKEVAEARKTDHNNRLIAALGNVLSAGLVGRAQSDARQELNVKPAQIQPLETESMAQADAQARLRDLMTELSIIRQAQAKEDDPYKEMRLRLMHENLLERIEDRKRKTEQFNLAFANTKNEEFDKKIEKISNRLEKAGIVEKTRAFQDIDSYLLGKGVDLDNLTGKEKINIPGMGLMGSLRPDFLTPTEDINFRQNVQTLANQLLQTRSGTNVTGSEYARFLREAGTGKLSDERALLKGLAKMKKDIALRSDNITKAFGKEVQKEYLDRTNLNLLTTDKNKSSNLEDTVLLKSPNGEIARVKASEADKYIKKGAIIVE